MARAARIVTAPLRWWRSSLTLRVVVAALAGSLLVAGIVAGVLLDRVTDGIVLRAQEAARADGDQALAQIQQQLTGVEQVMTAGRVYDVARTAIARGTAAGYFVSIATEAGNIPTSGLNLEQSFPLALREAVLADPDLVFSTPTRVVQGGQTWPGLAVGATISAGQTSVRVFLAFPFESEQLTLRAVRTAVLVACAGLVLGVGLVAFGIARMTLRPIRVARRAAERLAAGELTQPMPVRGTDDLARLAVSMNHMANQLELRIRDLEQLSRLQQRFVADVSHELRTPLTTVRMAADVLYDGRDDFPPIEARSAVLLRREVDRFEALLADLLEISRFDAGAAVLTLDEADLADLIRSEAAGMAQLAQAAGSSVAVHGADEPLLAQLDVRRIARLIRNLLSNAVAHCEGRPIDLYVAADDDIVAFAVRDHGVGFTVDEAKQLFNRFWRADPARTRHIGGTGLGLAIAQEDVHLHQGWIHAWGRPGKGAQFRVTLPRRPDVVVTRSPLGLAPPDIPAEADPVEAGREEVTP
jgi:two-component system sensor histidine kinase MtrB